VACFLLLDLVLQDLGLDLQVRQLFAESLRLDPKSFSLLLADFDLLFHQDCPLDGDVILGLHVLERGRRVASLTLKVIVGHFYIA
jgi:hypothetical protein